MGNKELSTEGYSVTPFRRSARLKRQIENSPTESNEEEEQTLTRSKRFNRSSTPVTNEQVKTTIDAPKPPAGKLQAIDRRNLRRSPRFAENPKSPPDEQPGGDPCPPLAVETIELAEPLNVECEYETLRKARIMENKARMQFLGISRSAEELRAMTSSPKSSGGIKPKTPQKRTFPAPTRRSDRLKGANAKACETSLQGTPRPRANAKACETSVQEIEPEEWNFGSVCRRSSLTNQRSRTGRGTIYDSFLGICCHFCRQKTLCAEDGCMHCKGGYKDEPCIGNTECSACHSSNGSLCRACLSARYGEEMEARKNKNWMRPHCIEEKGNNPLWICNRCCSSLCLRWRKLIPTGIAIYQARELGFKSVANLLMDKLKSKGCAAGAATSDG